MAVVYIQYMPQTTLYENNTTVVGPNGPRNSDIFSNITVFGIYPLLYNKWNRKIALDRWGVALCYDALDRPLILNKLT